MKKYVYESLNEYLSGEGRVSKLRKRLNENSGEEITPEEFVDMVEELVALDDEEEAKKRLKEIFNQNPYMHRELGEVPGRDKYKKGIDIFINHYWPDYDQTSDADTETVIEEKPKENREIDRNGWLSPEEAKRLFLDIVAGARSEEDVHREIKKVFNKNPYMHEELGEVEGRNYYEDALKAFLRALKDKFPGSYAYGF